MGGFKTPAEEEEKMREGEKNRKALGSSKQQHPQKTRRGEGHSVSGAAKKGFLGGEFVLYSIARCCAERSRKYPCQIGLRVVQGGRPFHGSF